MRHFALLGGLVAQSAFGMGLFGISPSPIGYNMVKINPSTGVATPVAYLGYQNWQAINSMTYDPVNRLYVAVATSGGTSAQFIFINPMDWAHWSTDLDTPAQYWEAIEWMPGWPNPMVVTGGSNYYTQYLIFYNTNHVASAFTLGNVPGNYDMDSLFRDAGNNLNTLDVNNPVDGISPRHIIVGATNNNWTWTPYSNWTAHGDFDMDGAYDPVTQRTYLSRWTNLGYYSPNGASIINLPNYGSGINVGALAYGAEKVTITGNIVLENTISNFAFGTQRDINYAIKQGTTTVWSGMVTATTQVHNFSIEIPSDIQGPSIFEWDTGPHLVKKLIIVLPGYSTGFGTVNLKNGDCDLSGEVDSADIDVVIANFGNVYPNDPGNLNADVDCSGEVDSDDIDIVIACFGNVDD
ncbi:MAG: hypothetical protein JNK63_00480 [Chthonomonas sp.]|nr:hypothetical protein [Chthonomonas sp.]